MANVDKPSGFRPVATLSGAAYNGQMRKYVSEANLFMGDLVTADGTGSGMYPTCARGTAADALIGAVVGWEADPDGLGNLYCSSGTVVYIADDPSLIFEAQGESNIPIAEIGLNADFVVAAGSTVTGLSNMEIDGGGTTAPATTATLPLRLLQLSDKEDQDHTLTNNRVLVTINNHKYKGHTGTVGVA